MYTSNQGSCSRGVHPKWTFLGMVGDSWLAVSNISHTINSYRVHFLPFLGLSIITPISPRILVMDLGKPLPWFDEACLATLQKLPESDWRDPCSAELWLVEKEGYRSGNWSRPRSGTTEYHVIYPMHLNAVNIINHPNWRPMIGQFWGWGSLTIVSLTAIQSEIGAQTFLGQADTPIR